MTFLSGGTGTPKLLSGAGEVFPRNETVVVANTGDDVELGDLVVSPDCDTVLFERAGMLDRDTWWGIEEDSTVTHEQLNSLASALDVGKIASYREGPSQTSGRKISHHRRFDAVPEFMTIGDRDRAHHLMRSRLLDDGFTLTEITQKFADAYDLEIELLPMSDDPVATVIHTPNETIHFQEYWVGRQGSPRVTNVEYRGADAASSTRAVREALNAPVIIGPSNPVTSLGPMFAITGIVDELKATSVVAVSPFVGEKVFSGPAPALMRGIGVEPSTKGFADLLPMVDSFVLDNEDETVLDRPTIRTDTRIDSTADASRVATACRDALEEVA